MNLDLKLKTIYGVLVRIDSIGLSIALEFSGLKHNKEMFDNSGMDPRRNIII